MARLAVTYVLLIPLVLFAVHGGFSFEHSSWNSDLGAFGGKMAVVTTDSEATRDRVPDRIGLAFCLAAMAAYMRSLAGIVQAMPLMSLLPIYAMSSALWSQDAGTSLRSGFSLLVTTLFAFYMTERFNERQQMELLMLVGACVATASVILALGWPQFGLDHQLHEGAWQGLFTQKNVCAEATLFLLTPALALPAIGRYGQMLRAVYISCCAYSIILMTQSRTGWAITVLYLGFAGSLRLLGKFGRKDLLPLAATVLWGCRNDDGGGYRLSSLWLSLIGPSGSFSGERRYGARLSPRSFGVTGGYGFDAFWSLLNGEASRVFAATGWVVTSAHSGFLNVALELGLMGLALVL